MTSTTEFSENLPYAALINPPELSCTRGFISYKLQVLSIMLMKLCTLALTNSTLTSNQSTTLNIFLKVTFLAKSPIPNFTVL